MTLEERSLPQKHLPANHKPGDKSALLYENRVYQVGMEAGLPLIAKRRRNFC